MLFPSRWSVAAHKAGAKLSGTAQLFIAFLIIFGFTVQLARERCWRDPSSVFFQAEKSHELVYSALRRDQANHFIRQATTEPQSKTNRTEQPEICVGMASVARKAPRYFKDAVGSILDGLDEQERARMHLILFIAQTNQSLHPAYGEGWIENVADTFLAYDLPEEKMEELRDWEIAGGDFRQKALFDYTYLLSACERVGSPYIVILEDDVIALDGWFHRTEMALKTADEKTKQLGRNEYLYLRLFHTETFLGWNSEEWPKYLAVSASIVVGELLLILALRFCVPKLGGKISNQAVLILCFVCTPMCISLFFAAGRVTMLPLPTGLVEMPKFGCCSQGLAFPRQRIADVMTMLQAAGSGYVDMLVEGYANERDETRWAMVPSVLQHVGVKSSKSSKRDLVGNTFTGPEAIWSYSFETNDAVSLRQEHSHVLERERVEPMELF